MILLRNGEIVSQFYALTTLGCTPFLFCTLRLLLASKFVKDSGKPSSSPTEKPEKLRSLVYCAHVLSNCLRCLVWTYDLVTGWLRLFDCIALEGCELSKPFYMKTKYVTWIVNIFKIRDENVEN